MNQRSINAMMLYQRQFSIVFRPRGYETFFMLKSAEHEILNNRYKKNQEIQHFSGSDVTRMLFSLLINVKMSTVVGILTLMSSKINIGLIFMLSCVFYYLGA